VLADVLLDAVALVLPVDCAGCGGDGRALCSACRGRLHPAPQRRRLIDGTVVTSALRYEGVPRRVILALKEQGRTDVAKALAVPFATAIGIALDAVPGGIVHLAAMPIGRAAYRRRGYDPVRTLLSRAGFAAPASVLRDLRPREEQKSLGRQARAENLAGTMGVRGDIRARRFLLLDDVITTGATLLEAGRAIREAGGEVAAAVALAATPRLFGDSHPALGETRDIPSGRV
jgi:predicted amidophosphoribosyltransferase